TIFLNRGIAPAYAEDGSSIVVNQKCVRDCRINLDLARRQARFIPEPRRLRVGDVLINSTGEGTLGRVAQVLDDLGDCTVDTHVTIARPREDVGLFFFGAAMSAYQERLARMGVGATGQTELSRSAIGEITIMIPPAELRARFEG